MNLPHDVVHTDNVLMAEVGTLNTQLGRYVLRFLASEALEAEPISPEDERALAHRIAQLAKAMGARASRRGAQDPSTPTGHPLRDEQS